MKRTVAERDSPKVHHQLALTLRKMAFEGKHRALHRAKSQPRPRRPRVHSLGHRRGASRQSLGSISLSRKHAGDTKMVELERPMKAHMYRSLSREDEHVSEVMYHFNKALMLSHGDNTEAA